jgi:hypothetical protein
MEVTVADRSAVGAQGAPFPLVVERGKIHEHARATLADHPAYYGEEPIAPPTFLMTHLFWQELVEGANPWARVALDPRRGMHAEEELVFHGPPPRAGTRLTCRSRITEVSEKPGRAGTLTFARMVTELRDETGALVAEAILTGVERPA